MTTIHHCRRREQRLHDAAASLSRGEATGPDERCGICGRALTDHVSVERGIGPVCWDHLLDEMGRAGLPAAGIAPLQQELRF